ncbi:MAG: type II toxin-antitoxin system Phd/YefM family antitoxin [bacterium]
MSKNVPIAEIKSKFSEYISQVAFSKKRFVITKRDKPVAALVNIEDLKYIERFKEINGLYSVIGKWKHFEEIDDYITNAVEQRDKDELRDVSL